MADVIPQEFRVVLRITIDPARGKLTEAGMARMMKTIINHAAVSDSIDQIRMVDVMEDTPKSPRVK